MPRSHVSNSLGLAGRLLAWAAWQSVVLVAAFVLWANLFSEYGTYNDPAASNAGAIVFLALALWIGTWLPVRRWRASRPFTDT
jgi:hypothetical protein